MNISEESCSKIKRYFVYGEDKSLVGTVDVIKTFYQKGLAVRRQKFFLQDNLEWGCEPFFFENEEQAMKALKETQNE